jgi:hypothetical protein
MKNEKGNVMTMHQQTPIRRFADWLTLLACGLLLAACGGGGGNPGSTIGTGGGGTPGSPTPASASVVVTLQNPSGQPANSASAASPLTAKALVRDRAGRTIANALVTFSADATLVLLSPSAGTALTDASGVASVILRPASAAVGGAGKVVAAVTVDGDTVTGDANFAVGATALTLSPLALTPASIPAYGSTILTIDVLAAGVKYTDQPLNVNFASGCVAAGKATLAATVPTNNGTAQAVYRDQGCASNDVISATVDGVSKATSATLVIGTPAAASIQFSSATPTDRSIVIKGQGGISRTETATLKFKVFDTFNNPLARQNVRFSTVSPDVTINKMADSTDSNGEVITTVNSGTRPTTFRVQATLDSGVFTTSDSIVVTTGLPVQKAFSLSVTTSNVDGWNYDSGTTTPATVVNVLMADQFGNPVPDGAPVVFQTNMGAVGSSSKGACNTVNGGCSVDFRTQDPRLPTANLPATPCNNMGAGGAGANDSTRRGVATICASSTDGTTTVFNKIAIFFSGDVAANVYLDGSGTRLDGTLVDLGSVGATDSKVFSLLISDVNFNPMPAGTKVEITDITNGNATGVAPTTVQNIFPHSSTGDDPTGNVISGNQGSYHTITVGSAQPKPCLTPLVSTFNVSVTTPRGKTTPYPFKVKFTCP